MKKLRLILVLFTIAMLILASCVGGDSGTVTDGETTAADTVTDTEPDGTETETDAPTDGDTTTEEAPTEEVTEPDSDATTDETESETETETETETEPPKVNTTGDCGYPTTTDAKKIIGKVRLDSVKHDLTQADYSQKVKKTGNWEVTVSAKSGNLILYGWIGFSIDDYELGWRIGTDSDVPYTTEGATVVSREAAVMQAAQKEGFTNSTGYSYSLNLSQFTMGDEVHLLIKNKTDGTVYCFCELTINYSALSANLSTTALKQKYELGYGSSMDMSFFNPITDDSSVTAPTTIPP